MMYTWIIGDNCEGDISDIYVKASSMEEALSIAPINGIAVIIACPELGIDRDLVKDIWHPWLR